MRDFHRRNETYIFYSHCPKHASVNLILNVFLLITSWRVHSGPAAKVASGWKGGSRQGSLNWDAIGIRWQRPIISLYSPSGLHSTDGVPTGMYPTKWRINLLRNFKLYEYIPSSHFSEQEEPIGTCPSLLEHSIRPAFTWSDMLGHCLSSHFGVTKSNSDHLPSSHVTVLGPTSLFWVSHLNSHLPPCSNSALGGQVVLSSLFSAIISYRSFVAQ